MKVPQVTKRARENIHDIKKLLKTVYIINWDTTTTLTKKNH